MMNTRAQSSDKRQRECVSCCGVRYERWRFAAVPGQHAAARWKNFPRQCVECGAALAWPLQFLHGVKSEKRRRHRARQRYDLHRQRNLDLGLTAHGRPRQRVFLSREESKQRRADRAAARIEQRQASGLTTRGTPRVYRDRWAKQKAYNAFRESLGTRKTWDDVFGGRMENQKREAL